MMKLAVATEKLRKMLSANSDATMNLEYITEDYDLTGILTRDEFEVMSNDLLDRVEKNCKIAIQRAGIQGVHSVEILGGTSRMPILQRIYAKAFQVEQVNKTLNPEEAISRGCAVQAAMLSPLYKVKDFSIKDMVYYPLTFYYTPRDMDVDAVPELLFDEKNTFPVTKIINTVKNGPFRIRIFNEICGISTSFAVNSPEEANEYKIKVHIKMDKNGVLSLEKAERIEREEPAKEDEKMDEDKKETVAPSNPEDVKEGEKKAEDPPTSQDEKKAKEEEEKKKAKPKIKKIPLNFQSDLRGMDESSLKQAIDDEKVYTKRDKTARETLEKRNELESFIYESRANLTSTYKEFVKEEIAANILQTLQVSEEWIYDEGQDTTKEKYQEKLSLLKDYVQPIQLRKRFYEEIPSIINNLEEAIKYSYENFNATDEKYAHILDSDRQAFMNKAKENQEHLKHIKEILAKSQKFEDLGISTDDLVKRASQQREVTNQVMNRPKPAPPKAEEKPSEAKSEEKSEAKSEEKSDEQMKSEESKEEKPMEVD